MSIVAFLLWMSFAFLAGMLTLGVLCFVGLQIWIAAEEADELFNCDL